MKNICLEKGTWCLSLNSSQERGASEVPFQELGVPSKLIGPKDYDRSLRHKCKRQKEQLISCFVHQAKEYEFTGTGLHTQTLLAPRISVFPRQDGGYRGEGARAQLEMLQLLSRRTNGRLTRLLQRKIHRLYLQRSMEGADRWRKTD